MEAWNINTDWESALNQTVHFLFDCNKQNRLHSVLSVLFTVTVLKPLCQIAKCKYIIAGLHVAQN